MFIPYPSWFFPIPGPFSPRALIEGTKHNAGIITSHFGDIHKLRAIPIWRMRDTPLRSVYRLYELHLADHYELMGWETEYFFYRQDWKLRDILNPIDPDPLRHAIVASIVDKLHEAVNWRLSLGLRRKREHMHREEDGDPWPPFTPEELPYWTKSVAPIDKDLLRLSVPAESLDAEGNLVLGANGKSPNLPGVILSQTQVGSILSSQLDIVDGRIVDSVKFEILIATGLKRAANIPMESPVAARL